MTTAPRDLAELAELVRRAAAAGEALAPRGSGTWWPDAAPGARPVSLAALDVISDFNPADLVVTAGAGVPLGRLAARLAERGVWLPLDPPGSPARTVGGALATGSGGPLAAHYGPARDHVLGLVVVAGDGTVLRLGGRVMKNVAGLDLAKLVIGGCGAFGVIAEAHLRLRARPRTDRTAVWLASADRAARVAAAALAAGAVPAALEVMSPPLAAALGWGGGGEREWALAVRALGNAAEVAEELEMVASAAGTPPALALEGEAPWTAWRETVGTWPVVLRVGAEPAAWPEAVALAAPHLGVTRGPAAASVTVPRGTVRLGAARCAPEAARVLRAAAAARGWPVTLERADAATRAAVGIWGALPPATDALAHDLAGLFDPAGCLGGRGEGAGV